jgi:hypothetical protein
VVTIEDKRTDWWEFNIVGLTDKLSTFNNLSDLNDPDAALENLGLSTAGVNIAKLDVLTENGYLRINPDGTVSLLTGTGFVSSLNTALSDIFLKKSNNLNDLNDKPAARSNLDVYGKSEVYQKSDPIFQSVVEIIDDVSGNSDLDSPTKIVFSQYGNLVVVTGEVWFSSLAGGTILNIPTSIGNPVDINFAVAGESSGGNALLYFNPDGTIVLVNAPSPTSRHHLNMSYITDTF